MSAVDQRTHLRCRLERVAERDRARDPSDVGEQSILHLLVNDDARARVTRLALVVIDAPRDAFRSSRQVRVLHDHLRAFPPALEGDALEVRLTGVAQHQLADLGRAREAHHVDIAVQG